MEGRTIIAIGAGTALAGLSLLGACKGVDFVAREGTTITITANPEQIAESGGSSRITAVVIEASGYPVADKTVVRFTTTLGQITPETETRDGLAYATLTSSGESGDATVTAFSGSVSSNELTIQIGVTASAISLTASPATLPVGGGTVTLNATVFGEGGKPVPGVSVAFSTDQGTLTSGGNPVTTGSDGVASDQLTTSLAAQVTVRTGTQTATITVDVGASGVTNVVLSADRVNIAAGDSTNLVAVVLGDGGPLPGVAVAWTATNGTLATAGLTVTDSSGRATNTLTTARDSQVTASAGGQSDSLTITVGTAADVNIEVTADRSNVLLQSPCGSGVTWPCTTPRDFCSSPTSEFPITFVAVVTDDSGKPLANREVVFFVDFSFMGQCELAFGEFCSGVGSATTGADGKASVTYTMTDEDINYCNCLQTTSPCPTGVGIGECATGNCATTQCQDESGNFVDSYCAIAMSALSGGVLSDNAWRVEYGR